MNVQRLDSVDLLRGAAMLWMTFFHLCFDLSQAGLIAANFYADPLWTLQRTCILGMFLLCAGAGQAIALQQGQSWHRFWRRWVQIAACALLVTAGSALMFPGSLIYFGVLHGMAIMLIVVRLTAGLGVWLWPLGAAAIAMKTVASYAISTGVWSTFLNEKWLNWLGLVSVKPITEDYVPLIPWIGVMWWGMALTQWWVARAVSISPAPSATQTLSPVLRPIAALGRWSLSYYMLHQPVLLGVLWVLTASGILVQGKHGA
ncbi:MAG: hypothetical protein RLZZ573_1458 [Pseudomonadota bacterium]